MQYFQAGLRATRTRGVVAAAAITLTLTAITASASEADDMVQRGRYLAEIAESGRRAQRSARDSAEAASLAHGLYRALEALADASLPGPLDRYPEAGLADGEANLRSLRRQYNEALDRVGAEGVALLKAWPKRASETTVDSRTDVWPAAR